MWRRPSLSSMASFRLSEPATSAANSTTSGSANNSLTGNPSSSASDKNSTGGGSNNGSASGNNSTLAQAAAAAASSFLGSDPKAHDRVISFVIEVPTAGPLGLDLRARHVNKGKTQRGAVVKGFRALPGGAKGFVEETGRVKNGDILFTMNDISIDDLAFEEIVQLAAKCQQDASCWPLKLEFRREPDPTQQEEKRPSRRSSFFARTTNMINPAQDGSFNEKLTYFRGFFANRMPTGGSAPKAKEKPTQMPSPEVVNEMYRDLLLKRGVPDDVMEELIRIEPIENKWQIVWYAQQNENDEYSSANKRDAIKVADSLVELNWDNKGLQVLEQLHKSLSYRSSEWIETFLERFGLDYLTMKLPDPSPFPVEHSKFDRATHICDTILRICRSVTHFTAGVEAITNTPGLVKRVALCFHTDDGNLKTNTLQLLGIVCYNSAAGHQAVVEAFDYFQEAKGETIRFSCLRDALKSTRYSLGFKEDVLSFVNIIVNKAIRLEDRLAIRSDFMALRMAEYFEEVRAKSLAVQRQKLLSEAEQTIKPKAKPTTETPPQVAVKQQPTVVPRHPTPGPGPTPSPGSGARTPIGGVEHTGTGLAAAIAARMSPVQGPIDAKTGKKSTPQLSPKSPAMMVSPSPSLKATALSTPKRSVGAAEISTSVEQLRNQLDNMEKQIEVFETFMEDDRKDTIYDKTDLSSLASVFETLQDNLASDHELTQCLLSIMQQLLFIPADRVIGKEMWALCEQVTRQIALLSPLEEVKRFELSYEDRKALLSWRDRFTEFLQKTSEETGNLVEYKIGPLDLIRNRTAEDLEEEGESGDEGEEESEDDSSRKQWTKAKDHEKYNKYFKLLAMGMPKEHVVLKMQSEQIDASILDTPDAEVDDEGELVQEDSAQAGVRVADHEKYAKFFKLLKMGMPKEHVALKMSAEGLNPDLLETPDVLLDEEGNEIQEAAAGGIPVQEHEKYVKFFKLLKMGMPIEHVKLKCSSEGLKADWLETPDKLLDQEGNAYVEAATGIRVDEHEKYAKFFKLLKMGMPMEHVKLKCSSEGLKADWLETPDKLLDEDGNEFVAGDSVAKLIRVDEHEKFAKFFKLLKMGMPMEHVKLKASSEGLNADLFEKPDTLLDEEGNEITDEEPQLAGTPAKEHEKYAKYFKLQKMGMPAQQIKLKMSSEGLDGNILDTPDKLLDADGNEVTGAGSKTPQGMAAKDHEKYAKFFKLMKMGMPKEQIQLKMQAEGLDEAMLDKPDALLDDEGNEIVEETSGIAVKDHEKYAKFFKLMKMGMPRAQLELKMQAEGLTAAFLDCPDKLLDAEGNEIKQGIPAKEHDKYAKFFKLARMGMPAEQIKLKMTAEGLDGNLLDSPDTLVDEEGRVVGAAAAVKAMDHPDYAKYFKLMKMGMPRPQIELKLTAEGLDPSYLDTPEALVKETVAKKEEEPKKPVKPAPPKPKLRNLYWDTVSASKGTIWESLNGGNASENGVNGADHRKPAENHPETSSDPATTDSTEAEDQVLAKYSKMVAEIFVNKPAKTTSSAPTSKKGTLKRKQPTRVALIDVKRANNIGIMLARFRVPYSRIKEALLQVDKEILTVERISALVQFAPLEEELQVIQGYQGDPKLLGDAEQYFHTMLAVPRLKQRLEAIQASWQMDQFASEQQHLLNNIEQACHELRQCDAIREIIGVVLTLGNQLNAGTPRGAAQGFRLSILLKLGQVKASDNSMTLLNVLAKILREKDASLLCFEEQLPSIEAASRITLQMLKAGANAVKKAAKCILHELEMHAKWQETQDQLDDMDRFQQEIAPLGQRAEQLSQEMDTEMAAKLETFRKVVIWYGEEASLGQDGTAIDFGPDAFFSIFYSFAKLLQAADRENERKRVAEERKKRREEETKKRLERLQAKKEAAAAAAAAAAAQAAAEATDVDAAQPQRPDQSMPIKVGLARSEEEDENDALIANGGSSLAALKEGDAQDIVSRIRSKRSQDKKNKQRMEEHHRLRTNSKSSSTPGSERRARNRSTSSSNNSGKGNSPSRSPMKSPLRPPLETLEALVDQ